MDRVKIAVVVTARPSWAKLQSICEALRARPEVELQIVACASALLERYGRAVDVIKAQGFSIAAECWSTYEGANLVTSVKESGALCGELAGVISRLRPDIGMVCADRHEVLAAAQAFAFQHVSLCHIQGGEKSGSIDDKVRDSITALADYHFTCTEQAAYRVVTLTGRYDRVWNVGCSSIDIAKRAQSEPPVTAEELGGAGAPLDMRRDTLTGLPLVIWLQHPVTSEADHAEAQAVATATALHMGCYDVLALWPGQDAGAEAISKVLRRNQEHFHTVRNLPPNRWLRLLTQASVLVGNSSCGIRECAYLGAPVVNVGTRQWGRERAGNVIDVPHDADQIHAAIERQVAHGRYPSSSLYGTGNSGERIAEVLACEQARF